MKKSIECNLNEIKPGEHFLLGTHEFIGIDICHHIDAIDHSNQTYVLELKEKELSPTSFTIIPTVVLMDSNQSVLKLL